MNILSIFNLGDELRLMLLIQGIICLYIKNSWSTLAIRTTADYPKPNIYLRIFLDANHCSEVRAWLEGTVDSPKQTSILVDLRLE